jgi:hypothetical protein
VRRTLLLQLKGEWSGILQREEAKNPLEWRREARKLGIFLKVRGQESSLVLDGRNIFKARGQGSIFGRRGRNPLRAKCQKSSICEQAARRTL